MSISELEQTFLVTDDKDIPLLMLPFTTVLRQKLFYRLVAVALLSINGKLFLRKRTAFPLEQKKKAYWGLPLLSVQQKESRQEVAEQIVKEAVGSFEIPLQYSKTFQIPSWHNFHGTVFSATLPNGITPLGSNDMWLCVDQDELQGLVAEIPEMLAPEVLWALEKNMLFSQKK